MKKQLTNLILVVLCIGLLSSAALLAQDAPERASALELGWGADNVLSVSLTAPGATNGRLLVSYDPALKLESVKAADSGWIVSTDTETPGKLAFAWVASDLPAGSTLMLSAQFDALVDGAAISAEATELYENGAVLPAPEKVGLTLAVPVVENPFTDIDGHWAKDDILAAYAAGLMQGYGNGIFAPEDTLERGMIVTILYRMAGSPAVTGTQPFADVKAGAWYEDAVLWAYQSGIVKGVSATEFEPEEPVIRQDLVTMLYRYAEWKGQDVSARGDLSAFADSALVEFYAQVPMQWAVGSGLIIGDEKGMLNPDGTATRAEMATLAVRFTKN